MMNYWRVIEKIVTPLPSVTCGRTNEVKNYRQGQDNYNRIWIFARKNALPNENGPKVILNFIMIAARPA